MIQILFFLWFLFSDICEIYARISWYYNVSKWKGLFLVKFYCEISGSSIGPWWISARDHVVMHGASFMCVLFVGFYEIYFTE